MEVNGQGSEGNGWGRDSRRVGAQPLNRMPIGTMGTGGSMGTGGTEAGLVVAPAASGPASPRMHWCRDRARGTRGVGVSINILGLPSRTKLSSVGGRQMHLVVGYLFRPLNPQQPISKGALRVVVGM